MNIIVDTYFQSLCRLFQVLLDTSGVLKYADFGLSKVEGENLEELFFKFAEAGEHWNIQSADDMMKQITTSGTQVFFLCASHSPLTQILRFVFLRVMV